jgi:hypothetical protein
MDGDLILSLHQVDFGEDGKTEKQVGVVVDMTDWVAVGNGSGVQRSVVAAGTPTVIPFWYDVKSGKPRTL